MKRQLSCGKDDICFSASMVEASSSRHLSFRVRNLSRMEVYVDMRSYETAADVPALFHEEPRIASARRCMNHRRVEDEMDLIGGPESLGRGMGDPGLWMSVILAIPHLLPS